MGPTISSDLELAAVPAMAADPRAHDGLLDADAIRSQLVARGIADDASTIDVTELGGGISNVVLRASWPGGCAVTKQALRYLRVDVEWEFDPDRIFVEAQCMSTLSGLMPEACPHVLFVDRDQRLLAMTCAPGGGVVWKDAHMAADVRPERADAAARLLARMQVATAGRPDIAERFDDLMPLEQGRLDPYHRTAASAHPELAGVIGAEVERLLATRRVLVHGDFSPKNLIAYDDGRMVMLDFEVAHWGDPAFDPAFVMSHLVLGACLHTGLARDFIDQAERFWRIYRDRAGNVAANDAAVIAELGCLLLARIDGKSPVEYLDSDHQRNAVRRYARALLLGEAGDSVLTVLSVAGQVMGLET